MQTQSLTDHLDALQRRIGTAASRSMRAAGDGPPRDARAAGVTAMFAGQAYDWLMLAADAALRAEREAQRLSDGRYEAERDR